MWSLDWVTASLEQDSTTADATSAWVLFEDHEDFNTFFCSITYYANILYNLNDH